MANLNPKQEEAVTYGDGPLLVLAGAGTGKTKVLTSRIAYLIDDNIAFPSQILAVTFTNKAAKEMRERVTELCGPEVSSIWLGTFHSIALRILRNHHDMLGLDKDFSILDSDDQLRLIKQLCKNRNIDSKDLNPKLVLSVIQRLKDKGINSEKATADDCNRNPIILELYQEYQLELSRQGVVDFGDLLLKSLHLLQFNPEILKLYHQRFKYILVDEYQDTNIVQYLWLRLLALGNHNIFCVGDDDQSIYGWRGAEIRNILNFTSDFGDKEKYPAHIIRLEQNYRSTANILGAAGSLIDNNDQRLGKTLFTEGETGSKIKLVNIWDEKAEANWVCQQIKDTQDYNENAVLVRAGSQTRAFEEAFISAEIPYQVIGGLKFYERMEIRDMIAYIRIIMQPTNDLALERVINTPKRAIGNATVDKMREFAKSLNKSIQQALPDILGQKILSARAHNAVEKFSENLALWRESIKDLKPAEAVAILLEETGYKGHWTLDKSIEAKGRIENLNELLVALESFPNLSDFLEHVSLVSDGDENKDEAKVSIMTMHAAKGLEFDNVYLGGWESGLFPSQRSLDESGEEGLQEERRLAYVGMTRAKKNLNISFAANRRIFGQWSSSIPSRFINEIDEKYIEKVNLMQKTNSNFQHKTQSYIKSTPVVQKETSESGISPDSRIFHQKFGYGTVTKTSGKNLTIKFAGGSTRTIMEDFVTTA